MEKKRVSPKSRDDIKKIANMLRELLGLESSVENPVVRILEFVLCSDEIGFNFEIVDDVDIGDCEAISFPDKNFVTISNSVYENACDGNPRALFTLAHEIGHLLLHKNQGAYARTNSGVDIKAYEDSEWQANTFAAEFLMPEELCFNLTPEEISKKFNVSLTAAEVRYRTLNKAKKMTPYKRGQ
jgi:Zn-dependent peptidase ImmA (M78 family)